MASRSAVAPPRPSHDIILEEGRYRQITDIHQQKSKGTCYSNHNTNKKGKLQAKKKTRDTRADGRIDGRTDGWE